MRNLERQLQLSIKECDRLKKENLQLKNLLRAHNIEFKPHHTYEPSNNNLSNKKRLKKEFKYTKICLKVGPMYMQYVGNQKPENQVILQHVN
ncbi:hypothetical protein [Bacillus yapensis]|uniref:hypothetical protein n=1 Tax=Bacillus yapensis TaxID=2492960 RepID=UPI001FE34E84|nr:hypothetical protein [Bacillus yapensis]